ncbi:MAG: hypothetical protein A4E58_01701 [Syntrophorhabdus sp. PtaB.Bin006]|nr:MAG: hypothetical protein A4E58_01701 [Syntrophorhabdus sp. PtaB.Bin006]
MNLYRNRIPSTIPFPRQAPDLTRHYVPLRSMLKCEDNMVCWGIVVLRKERGNHIGKSFRVRSLVPDPIKGDRVAPSTSKAVGASPSARRSSLDRGYLLSDPGIPGTTHRHVTGPQVVPQCSLKEQPSAHAIRIFHRFYPSTQSLQTYLSLKGSYSCTIESNSGMNNPLQKKILTRFFLPDSHNRRGESGLSGRRHGGNASDVDELRVLADRRRTERTSEGARRSRSRGTHLWVMGISIRPLTDREKN